MGFDNPATDSAEAFRVILNAMARPGRISKLGQKNHPEILLDSTWALLLTLVDHAGSVFLPNEYALPTVIASLQFQTGARIAVAPDNAAFVLAKATEATSLLEACDMGSPEYPDRSTTLIVQCEALLEESVTLSGPGIQTIQNFGASGVAAPFWQVLAARRQHYPRGTDVFFTAPGQIAAIPRSTRIEVR